MDMAHVTEGGYASAELAEAFRRTNAEAVELLSNCPSDRWARTAEEGWTVPATAMRIAVSHPLILTWVRRVASNLPVLDTLDDFAVQNAADAEKYSTAMPADVISALKEYGAPVERFITALTAADVRGTARLEFVNAEWSAEQVVRRILIGHVRDHLAHIATAIGD